MTGVNDIRAAFLEFFGACDHEIVSSSPLVPLNDPTLMFVNAGMVQFKNVFTGQELRDYARAATSQKCVRAGGKHNDLDNVGYTARHHTFFEMLGNFSFGDYFKELAIEHAWELLTRTYGLSPERLTVTVYHDDDDAYNLWRKIAGLPEERIIRIATSDNFWAMGDTGPCGPCSEIFYDHGDHLRGGPPGSADEDGDRFVEIWNLVFMQFEQLGEGERVNLPKPSIDTGMGLERIAAVLQGTHDNYEIDSFRRLISASEEIVGVKAAGEHRASHRVIADHLRATSFLIADGVLPSNEGRGFVLRRIMRRAILHIGKLGFGDLLLHRLVPTLVGEMGAAYPELVRAEALISATLKLEEERFKRTLMKGNELLTKELVRIGEGVDVPAETVFKLHDTYGYPVDLTVQVSAASGNTVAMDGFDRLMTEQRNRARKAWVGSGETATEAVWFDLREECGATEFLGYEAEAAEGQIVGLVKGGERTESVTAGDEVMIITNQTPFYGESGGQIGDIGIIRAGDTGLAIVTDTKKQLGDMHVHMARVDSGQLALGDAVDMAVDGGRRRGLRAHHSVTHLMHEALRQVLGEHVTQKGSLVASDRLRFDFSHPKAVSDDELVEVAREVNRRILENQAVSTRLMTPDNAIEAGALALFGEKYGDEVRVVAMGGEADATKSQYSVELCGGTHVGRVGEIGIFHIISEGAVAAGVRRIEALAGEAARQYFVEQERTLQAAALALKTRPAELTERISALVKDKRAVENQLAEAKRKLALGGDGAGTAQKAEDIAGVQYIRQKLDGMSPKDLRGLADAAKKSLKSGVVAFVTVNDGKAALLVGVTDDLSDRISAVELVRAGVISLGGSGGGGRPDMAQAGGPDGSGAEAALEVIKDKIAALA